MCTFFQKVVSHITIILLRFESEFILKVMSVPSYPCIKVCKLHLLWSCVISFASNNPAAINSGILETPDSDSVF